MSIEINKANLESEDLITTEELLTQNKENATQNVEESEHFDVNTSEDEFLTEMETEAELLEGIAQEDSQMDNIEQKNSVDVQEVGDTGEDDENKRKLKPASKGSTNRISELPLSKVKHIIKLDPEVNLVNGEAVFLITKATESFIKLLAKESFSHAEHQRKKTITNLHVEQAIAMLPIEL